MTCTQDKTHLYTTKDRRLRLNPCRVVLVSLLMACYQGFKLSDPSKSSLGAFLPKISANSHSFSFCELEEQRKSG